MAPTFRHVSTLSNKEKHKLRKPAVEKMRRDRINTSIEQLKAMLEKQFHQHQPNAKLEKADVLEMTVLFLKQKLQQQTDGYSQCFLSPEKLLKQEPGVWRPW